jgi:cytidylate kinase
MRFVVTLDGPGAAGKSTTARAVAERLGFLYLDTGALYRALALKVLQQGIPPDDPAAVERCARDTHLEFSGAPGDSHVRLDGTDVSQAIRTPRVSELASRLAAQPGVRRRLVEIQRELGMEGGIVAEGRDLGTVVFPDAEVKLFLQADLDTRARRRHRELQSRRIPATLDEVREELARRDARDESRADSPLKPAPDAVVIDTSGMDVEAQIEAVLQVARRHPRWAEVERSARGRAGREPAAPEGD